MASNWELNLLAIDFGIWSTKPKTSALILKGAEANGCVSDSRVTPE